ncbi:unnamed protein product [Zymoseptoria tritici ST99CH_1A5]|uniref:Uncharacterized protein n=2 Tax=Zymoseptoria tritici TaxID=1047171 RepID=A0A2H1GQI2_ZYMTR|nr:unnamed protein product [Zymoseptoria tritici ST99CH_1E4]SMY26605.1 unnamed protein product [Zymoseptoria tritici ST99CH_1A5]
MDAPSTLSTPVCTTMKAKIMTGSDRTAMQDGWAKLNGQDRTRAVSEADGTGPDQWPVLAVGYGHVEVAAEKVALGSHHALKREEVVFQTPGGPMPDVFAISTLRSRRLKNSPDPAPMPPGMPTGVSECETDSYAAKMTEQLNKNPRCQTRSSAHPTMRATVVISEHAGIMHEPTDRSSRR